MNDAVSQANAICKNTMMEHLQIEFTVVREGYIEATMPVDNRTHQPMGLLHGGASAALAESAGSLGSSILINTQEEAVVGIELSANHLRSRKDGVVTAKATIEHRGRSLHVWTIRIEDEEGKLVSLCRLTNMVVANRKSQ